MRVTASIDVIAGTHHQTKNWAKYPPPRLSTSVPTYLLASSSVYGLVHLSSSLPQTVRGSKVTSSYAYLRRIEKRGQLGKGGDVQGCSRGGLSKVIKRARHRSPPTKQCNRHEHKQERHQASPCHEQQRCSDDACDRCTSLGCLLRLGVRRLLHAATKSAQCTQAWRGSATNVQQLWFD